ncbi:uncharacterized protein LOC119078173 [Bradysia coprophila]|uniref:uncharacterized protein LOC119078173 n=1 Tax=Bradysia coprophila TaxID=38358 RepID=UPI00187D863A|nr:uncharacterized protein LOC119078173 [Bradysia coprophila]
MSSSRDGFKQKVGRQNSMSTITNLLNHNNSVQNANSTSKTESDEYVPIFYNEISDIMRGFGDCQKPLKESIILVDKILLQQLRGILQEVIQLAVERKGKPEPSLRDFEFLMRKNPVRVYRLQHYLTNLQKIRRIQEMNNVIPSSYHNELESNEDAEDEEDRTIPEQKNDEEKLRRHFRADRISQILGGAQYKEYSESRRTSFSVIRNSTTIRNKLRLWLKPPSDTVMSNRVYTILSYLAHETIAAIVDFSILTRLNSANRQTEPYSRIMTSGASHNMLHLCPEVTQGRGMDGIKPITVQEIQEAVRRHTIASTRTLGLYRNMDNSSSTVPFLAI